MEARILKEFRAIVGAPGLITEAEQLSTYECDGLTMFRVMPQAVLLPTSTRAGAGASCASAIARRFPLWHAVPAPG